MAFDQTSLPNDLRPINIVRSMAEEPRIAPVPAVTRPPEGYYGNQVREMGSPVYYPAGSEAGFAGVYGNPTPGMAMWAPQGAVPVAYQSMSPAVGYGYNPNLATRVAYGGPGDLVGNVAANASSGLSPNVGHIGGSGVDTEPVSGVGYAPNLNLNTRIPANPAEQIPIDPAHGYGYIQNPSNRVGNPVDQASEEIGDDSVSGKKVKFLCSFGGKILPRPSDGLLRYVSGHTRIISVRRDVSYNELVQKMVDTYGQPVYIKYQLPDEDLDALVSVSCTDDLDNMMDEYDKLNERSPDGSGKLRVFLFSHSELDPTGMVQFGNMQDTTGQRYVDAVNGIADWTSGAGNAITRKESITSATSTHSDFSGNEAVDTGIPSQGDFNSAFLRKQNSGNSDDISPSLRVPIKSGPPRTSSPHLEVDLERSIPLMQQPGMEIPAAPGYVQAYADPRREVAVQTDYRQLPPQMGFQSPQFHVNTTGALTHQYIPSSHVTMRQNVVQPMLQTQPARLDNFVDDQGYGPRVVQMPVEPTYTSYQIPVPPSAVGGSYGWNQMPTQVYPEGFVSHQQVIYTDSIPRSDCYMCQKALPHAHSDTMAQGQRETPADSSLSFHSLRSDDHSRSQPLPRVMVSGSSGETAPDHGIEAHRRAVAHLDPQGGNFQPEASGFIQNPEEKIEHSRISAPQATNIQPPNGAYMGAIPLSRDDSVQQHLVPGQYVVRPDPVNKAVNREIPPVVSVPVQTPPTEYSNMFPGISPKEDNAETCVTYDQMRPIEVRMGNLRMGPTEASTGKEHSDIPVNTQYAPASRLAEPYEVAQPPLWGDPDSYAQSNPTAPPLPPTDVHFVDPPPSLSPSSRIVDAQDSSNSLFSNQDPWNMRQDTQFPPPRPGKTPTKKDSFVSKDPFGNNIESNSTEDGMGQTSSALSSKEHGSEHSVSAKGSAEEQIRNDLQAVAEGVAASVLQSTSGSEIHVKTELGDEATQEADVGNKPEDAKSKFPEKANKGFPVSDGIGRLQIIKNVDLEELKELGSGTFGTVYHAKWRGTDVAIKRINDRCFAGKPSEQERMRDDFWNEAIKLADLHHPNVLAFYGVVLDGPGGSVATVTEYMVNGSLRNALQKNEKSLDKRKRLLIAMDVAFGMEYLHGKNIVHFDLKSDNLLVNLRDPHRPICKVGDLGLSKVKCQTLISGGVRGTLPWMAPELLNGSSSLVSEKVDVFSYGIVMWELLTGEEPYADLHYGAIIGGIVSNTLRPQIPEFCDPDWKVVMERCWSSEPSERPSFTEIANQLRSIAAKIPPKGQGSPQQQTPPSQSSV